MLTKEQQLLVEQNHDLIYRVLDKNNWSIEDYYGVAAISLCEAAESYKPSFAHCFSTYARYHITRSVEREIKNNANTGFELQILDNTVKNSLEDISNSAIGYAIANEIIENLNTLPPKQKEIIRLMTLGYRQGEIGNSLGISSTRVQQLHCKSKWRIQSSLAVM